METTKILLSRVRLHAVLSIFEMIIEANKNSKFPKKRAKNGLIEAITHQCKSITHKRLMILTSSLREIYLAQILKRLAKITKNNSKIMKKEPLEWTLSRKMLSLVKM